MRFGYISNNCNEKSKYEKHVEDKIKQQNNIWYTVIENNGDGKNYGGFQNFKFSIECESNIYNFSISGYQKQ